MSILKKTILFLVALTTTLQILPSTIVSAEPVGGWEAGNIISDGIFTNKNSMDVSQIQQFLNSKVPVCDTNGTQPSEYGGGTRAQWGQANYGQSTFICLKDYSEGGKSAAQIIYDKAQAYTINPQVLLVLLQKEQGLVTDTWPLNIQYRSATGYGCPDTAPCDSQYYGLTNQLDWAAKMFRAILNNSPTWYTPYVLGNNFIRYNPSSSCGGTNVNIENRSTQALYNYTPYQPNQGALAAGWGTASCGAYGNRNFYLYFQSWFGSTRFGRCINGYSGAATDVNFRKIGRVDYADFSILAGASTGCVEAHIWNSGFTSWKLHSATIAASVKYPDVQLTYADLDGNGNDYPILFAVGNTGSGKIEAHIMNKDLTSFIAHVASNQAQINSINYSLEVADLDGDGKESPVLVNYNTGTSGRVEINIWGEGMQSWKQNINTNLFHISPVDNKIVFADTNGDGKDEAIVVSLKNTGSSKVEFHVWNQDFQDWSSHTASNMPQINPADSKVVFADTNGDGKDEAILVGLKNTGSGKVEFHVWNQGFTSWRSNTASNQQTP